MGNENKKDCRFSSASHKQVSIMFVEWIQSEGYWKAAKRVGGRWFKIGVGGNYYTSELFDKFMSETEEELSKIELTEHLKNIEEASKTFVGI